MILDILTLAFFCIAWPIAIVADGLTWLGDVVIGGAGIIACEICDLARYEFAKLWRPAQRVDIVPIKRVR